MKCPRWTDAEKKRLISLAADESKFMTEIAKELGRSPASTRWMAHKLGIDMRSRSARKRMGQWNSKHAHLREPVMKYFLTHSMEETREHFGLTRSEIKSLFTVGYRDAKLKHLRKEWRPHSAWSAEDWRFMAQHVGVRPRAWIAKKLKRGATYNSVKDSLAKFRGSGKYFNGMPWGWAELLFGLEAHPLTIRTKAGPAGRGSRGKPGHFHYRILPWTECERLLNEGRTRAIVGKGKWSSRRRAQVAKRIPVSPDVRRAIHAMANFQRWIHGTKSSAATVRKIKQSLKGR